MYQLSEMITFIVSSILIIYLISLLRLHKRPQKKIWLLAILVLLASQACTILENFMLGNIMNILEHLFFLIACILLFVSIIKKEL